MTYHTAGAIDDAGRLASSIGLDPYKISGDPVTALVAQLNRFAGKRVTLGPTCGASTPVHAPFALVPLIDQRAATAAAIITWKRYNCVPIELRSKSKEAWAGNGMAGAGNPWAFVMNNLKEITVTIAQVADGLGLEPASVGITERDPKMTPKFPTMTVVLLGALAVAAVVVAVTRSKS